MKNLENLSVLLVVPDLQSKTKLREVLRTVLYKGEIDSQKQLKDLAEKLTGNSIRVPKVIFISGKIAIREIDDFLLAITSIEEERKPAIVIALPSASSHSSSKIASWYMQGVSGFISDPYTADDISILLTKILEQKGKTPLNDEIKAKKASSFLFSDAISLVDEVSKLASEGKEGGFALRDLKTLSNSLREFYEKDPTGYAESIVQTFQKAAPPSPNQTTNKKKVKTKIAKHPGVLVWELMSQRNIASERLPLLLKITAEEAAALTRGNFKVTEVVAQNLARVFGMTPREWLKMQKDFDDYQESIKTS